MERPAPRTDLQELQYKAQQVTDEVSYLGVQNSSENYIQYILGQYHYGNYSDMLVRRGIHGGCERLDFMAHVFHFFECT